MKYDIKNIQLAKEGRRRIDWAEGRMPVLGLISKRFRSGKPLDGIRIGACLHVTAETANLMLALKAGGSEVALCASNPLSTQDDVAASLVENYKIPVFAVKGEDNKTYYKHIEAVLDTKPQITMDDGGDLVSKLHKSCRVVEDGEDYKRFSLLCDKRLNLKKWDFFGSSEETTTGVIRLRAMEKDKALKVPVVAVNDSYTKYLFDNRYGTGQSTVDGILRATNILLAGKKVVVCGYGWCGRGLAKRMAGMGAEVIVTEVDPIRALEARMDGFKVQTLAHALKYEKADIVVTTTGNKHVVDREHFELMKDGTILANSGHFNVEINMEALEKMATNKRQVREYVTEYAIVTRTKPSFECSTLGDSLRKTPSVKSLRDSTSGDSLRKTPDVKRIYVLGEGRLVNLVAAEGHPPEVMDMSFANQALAAEWFVQQKGKLKPKVYKLPEKLDKMVAELKLAAMGMKIDRLTREQKHYLQSWQEGT